MARIKGGANAKKKHNRVLKLARGYYGARSNQYRVAKQSVMRALASSYEGRKQRKRQFIFQEVLIRLWKGFDSFEGRSSEKTWVYRVALNTCVTADKKQRRRLDTSPLEMDVDLFAEEERNPAASRLHQRISKLHPFDRALILLWLEDLPYDEIAAILGISIDNVSVRLVRVREKLKKITD